MMGLAVFFLLVILPFFVVGAVDGIGIAVDVLLDAAAGTAGAAAFFLFFFVLAAAGGTACMGGREEVVAKQLLMVNPSYIIMVG
jgi:hypothetical protein